MTYVVPLVVPEVLVSERGVVPENDFKHAHLSVAFGPDGRGYVLSDLFYNYHRYTPDDDRDLRAIVVTSLDARFSIERVVMLEALARELTWKPDGRGGEEYVFNNDLRPITVTGSGEVVFCTTKNRTVVLDARLDARVATFDPLRGGPAGVSDLVVLPSGAMVCALDHDYLALAPPTPSLRDGIPALRRIGRLLELGGAFASHRAVAGDVAALDDDRILISRFVKRGRSGWIDHDEFDHVVLDGDGRTIGSLPLGAADSPYRPAAAPFRGAFAHRGLNGWVTRSEAAFHLFDRDGKRTLRLGIDDRTYASVAPLALLGVGPAGELLLLHRKHHTLTITSPIERPKDLAPALGETSRVYRSEHARLKKTVRWQGGRFLGYEPTAAPATAEKTSATKELGVSRRRGAKHPSSGGSA